MLLTARGDHYGSNWGSNAISYPMYQDFRDHESLNGPIFKGLMCRFGTGVNLSFEGSTERASGELVSGNYFRVLGVGALLGRTFTPEDNLTPGGHPVVVLSHGFWRARFASNRAIVGQTVIINGLNMTVVGVSEPGFDGVELGFSPRVSVRDDAGPDHAKLFLPESFDRPTQSLGQCIRKASGGSERKPSQGGDCSEFPPDARDGGQGGGLS